VNELTDRDRALVLVGAYAGLRWGEAAGLRRRDIDPLRSRIRISGTAVQLRVEVSLDNEPKTTRSKRTVPLARSVMRRLEHHLGEYVAPASESLVFTAPGGGPLYRSWGQIVLEPAVRRAGLEGITFHGLRHSFVAIMVAAGCNVREADGVLEPAVRLSAADGGRARVDHERQSSDPPAPRQVSLEPGEVHPLAPYRVVEGAAQPQVVATPFAWPLDCTGRSVEHRDDVRNPGPPRR